MSIDPTASRPPLGSATHGPHIFDLREPWGAPRFHPPGEHPATYRLRELRRWLKAWRERSPATRASMETQRHIDQLLADFEAGEDEAKRREWFYIRDRLGLER